MKDTHCEYCQYPYFSLPRETIGITDSDIIISFNNEDDTYLDIAVFHEGANKPAPIFDGSFTLKVKYCPICGRKL